MHSPEQPCKKLLDLWTGAAARVIIERPVGKTWNSKQGKLPDGSKFVGDGDPPDWREFDPVLIKDQ
jgi:hypothetical protein